MMAQNPEDSYSLAEEIAVRGLFRTKKPEYLADTFAVIYHELAADIDARARLVDIGLRYENNIQLGLAAARKIADLTDRHKILLIPAHIDLAPGEVAEAIAKQIHTIRSDDPRRHFFERWSTHENAAVSRICRAGRATFRENGIAYIPGTAGRIPGNTRAGIAAPAQPSVPARLATAARLATPTRIAAPARLAAPARVAAPTRASTASRVAAPTPKSAAVTRESARQTAGITPSRPPAGGTRIPAAAPVEKKPASVTTAAVFHEMDYAKLIGQIDFHLKDPNSKVRVEWIKKTGTIPASFDPDDGHKIRFITRGLKDHAITVNLEALAQIAFLRHDEGKLELLLLVIGSQPALLGSAEGQKVLGTLDANLKKTLDEALVRTTSLPVPVTPKTENRDAAPSRVYADVRTKPSPAAATGQAPPRPGTSAAPATGKTPERAQRHVSAANGSNQEAAIPRESYGMETVRTGSAEDAAGMRIYAAEEKKTAAEILSELDLPAAALAGLANDRTPVGALVREIAPVAEADRTDNYFLRHTAVLHIKDLRTEELRYKLYLSVLDNDRKDIVRQIAVQEARNLDTPHISLMFREALKDRAWQVRCAALDHLLPLMPDRNVRNDILQGCTSDGDYHVRQKAVEKMAESETSERLRK